MTNATKDKVRIRVQLSLTGRRAQRMIDLAEILGFDSVSECAAHLLNRGMEVCAVQVQQRDQLRAIQEQVLASLPDFQLLLDEVEAAAPTKGKPKAGK